MHTSYQIWAREASASRLVPVNLPTGPELAPLYNGVSAFFLAITGEITFTELLGVMRGRSPLTSGSFDLELWGSMLHRIQLSHMVRTRTSLVNG